MIVRICFLLVVFGLMSVAVIAQDSLVYAYVDKYYKTAVTEMYRTGVPASIKLAQGILESGKGQSTLALNSRNHFGIKCKETWEGESYYHFDDDFDENGKLIKSCFRKYEVPEHSYYDHSEFLLNRPYYTHLFELSQFDYKGWAIGLREAKYASLPTYDKSLIRLIERFDLNKYDSIIDLSRSIGVHSKQSFPVVIQEVYPEELDIREIDSLKSLYNYQLLSVSEPFQMNGLQTLNALPKERTIDFCERTGHSCVVLKKYNEWSGPYQLLAPFEYVYLEKKEKKWKSSKSKVHEVAKYQDIHHVAQLNGVRSKFIYKRNKMQSGEIAAVGQVLNVNKKVKRKPALRTSVPKLKPVVYEAFIKEVPVYKRPKRVYKEVEYTVIKGDSLWGLSRRFKVSLVSIRKWNNLQQDALEPGQIIKLKLQE